MRFASAASGKTIERRLQSYRIGTDDKSRCPAPAQMDDVKTAIVKGWIASAAARMAA